MSDRDNVIGLKERRAKSEKRFDFANDAVRKELLDLSSTIRRNLGFQLSAYQNGEWPLNTSSRNDLGNGVIQLEVIDENNKNTGRCFCVGKFNNTVYLIHSFKKLSRNTPKKSEDTCKKRYKSLMEKLMEENNV